MIGLRIGNEWLDIYPNTAINITMTNPVFDDVSLGRTFSYPFKIPLTAKNKSLLSHNHRLDTTKDTLRNCLPISLFINHLQFETGYLKVKKFTNAEAQIIFQDRQRNLIDELEQININEILDIVEIPENHSSYYLFRAISDTNQNVDGDVIISINLISFVSAADNNDLAAYEIVQLINANNDLDVNATLNGSEIFLENNTGEGLIINVSNRVQIISRLTLPEARQKNLQEFHNTIQTTPIPELSMPTWYDIDFYEGKNDEFLGFINYSLGGNVLENQGYVNPAWEHTYVPFVRIPYLLKKIFGALTIDEMNLPSELFPEDTDMQKLLLFNNYALDETFQYSSGTGIVVSSNGFKSEINLNDHVPEMTGLDFLKSFLFHFNNYALSQGGNIQFISKNKHLNTPARDWTNKSEPQYIKSIHLKDGFTLKMSNQDNDSANFGNQLDDYMIGEGDTILQSNFNTIHTILQTFGGSFGANSRTWYIPFLKHAGSSDELGQGQKEYSLRILLDHGIQQTSLGEDYQQSGNNSVAVDGTQIGERDLIWAGERGGYEKDWKGYAELIDNDTIQKNIRLTIYDLILLKKWEDFRRRMYHKEGTVQGYVKSVNFKATTKGITVSKIILIKE